MNIWQHLGELRRRLLICIYALLAGTAAGAFAVNPVIAYLAKPVGRLVFVDPTEAFTAQVKIAVSVSFLLVLPVLIYQFWAFVSLGLKLKEKVYLRWTMPVSYMLFLAGSAFATFLVFPKAMAFLLTLRSPYLEPMLAIDAYLNFFLMLGIAFGALFQLPLILHFLAKVGILRAEFLQQNRRISYLFIFVLATLVNPVPEVFTQVLLAGVAIALYEVALIMVRWEIRKRSSIT